MTPERNNGKVGDVVDFLGCRYIIIANGDIPGTFDLSSSTLELKDYRHNVPRSQVRAVMPDGCEHVSEKHRARE